METHLNRRNESGNGKSLNWGAIGALLGRYWGALGRYWGAIGALLGRFGALLRPYWRRYWRPEVY